MEPSELIDKQIADLADLADWRGELVAKLRKNILATDAGITEEWKWDTGVWTHHGMICAGAAFKDHVKLNFFKGASLPDPKGLFNAGLEAKTSRSIDFQKGDKINEAALKDLIRAAIAYNTTPKKK